MKLWYVLCKCGQDIAIGRKECPSCGQKYDWKEAIENYEEMEKELEDSNPGYRKIMEKIEHLERMFNNMKTPNKGQKIIPEPEYKPKIKRSKRNRTGKQVDEAVNQAVDLYMSDKSIGKVEAIQKVFGYQVSGKIYQKYKKKIDKNEKEQANAYMIKNKPKVPVDYATAMIHKAAGQGQKRFPAIECIDDKNRAILINMVQRIVNDPEIEFRLTDALFLGIDAKQYVGFIRSLWANIGKVAEYFGVENKFKLFNEGGRISIKYI